MRIIITILLFFFCGNIFGQQHFSAFKTNIIKPVAAGSSLLTGLVAYWKLDEASGSAIDAHSTHDGTVRNITQNSTGKINTAYTFDRLTAVPDDSTGIVIPTSAAFNLAASAGSISCWINSTLELYWSDAIVSSHNTDVGNSGYHIGLQADGSGNHYISCIIGSSASYQQVTDNTTIIDNSGSTWYHVVMTWQYPGNIKAYVNGNMIINTAISVTPVDAYDLNIGRSPAPYAPYWFDGRIDEVGIWNVVLTPSQVSELYNGGAAKAYSTF